LAKEAVERAVGLELGQLGGLDDAGQGATTRTEDPGTDQTPEGAEAGLGKIGLESLEEWIEGLDQQGRHRNGLSFINIYERQRG
jgi:hypothetical protein